MTGPSRSSDGLDPRRRRALFRAWHRGTREMDLLLGRFADTHIAGLDEDDLALFEALMEVPDGDLVPAAHATPLYAAIVAFHSAPNPIADEQD
jgi:antitoxin CptB